MAGCCASGTVLVKFMVIFKVFLAVFLTYWLGALFISGLFMLISPRAWLRLPRWLGVKPSEAKITSRVVEEYTSSSGAVSTRLMGASIVGLIAYMLGSFFSAHNRATAASRPLIALLVYLMFILAANGIFMFISPQRWSQRPWRLWARDARNERAIANKWVTRAAGAIYLLIAIFTVGSFFSYPIK
jgi:hypothetical protein